MLLSLGRRPLASDLIDLLLECHQRIRSFVALAVEVGRRADLPDEEVRAACARCMRYFTLALPLHVRDEEESLLPRLRGLDPSVEEALDAMHRQHDEHGPALRAFLAALQRVHDHPADLLARASLLDHARSLARTFEEHLDSEERVLFPALRARIPRETQDQILAELRARRS
jgi:iron-sulfur cluster repair protein YtfE (RIC family)